MDPFIVIPTYNHNSKTWSETTFNTRDDFKALVLSLFKEPGKYEFDECALEFNAQARYFQKNKYYCKAPFKSKDFIAYWDDQKVKCRNGVIFQNNGKMWYAPRDWYMWINFLPIYDKKKRKFDFPSVWDSQYHMALYELLAELHYKHSIILKKRQFGSSYYHIGKCINQYWFEEGAVLKLGASLKDYINEKGSWKYLDEYKNFLNEHTAWYRPAEPDKVGAWQQQIKVRVNGRDTYKGLKSTINAYSFEKDPTNGVGGPVRYFFHEEAGIAPKMNDTFEFILPALKLGMTTTGMFIAAGSVGDLDQCEPLKSMMLSPTKDIYTVISNLIDKEGTIGETALFIPEQWSMDPYIDVYGNSLVEEALEAIRLERIGMKKDLSPEQYQLRVSQHPINIEEAFAYRKESKFPQHLVSRQLKRIEDKEYPFELLELSYDENNKIVAKESNKIPISEFPISKKTENKEGCLVVWERPVKGAAWGTYYASIDPVGEGKTTTSESLCTIIVYKNSIHVIKKDGEKVSSFVEQGKIVASWTGRFDDINKTHERLERIIEWYNAWTVVENNVSLFIQYMISKRKQKYLVTKDQITFLKELGSNMNVFADYGWKNTGTLFKQHLLSYGIEFTKEIIESTFDENGDMISATFGIERIPDPMILKEMQAYVEGLNVDRLVAYCALIAFVRVQNAARTMQQRIEVENDMLENTEKITKLNMSPFRHIGMGNSRPNSNMYPKRNAFKNLR
jgi:hypothetical protein